MTPVKNADTMKFCCLFITKYIPAEQTAADIVLKIKKNFRPNLSMPSIPMELKDCFSFVLVIRIKFYKKKKKTKLTD